ncbi:helix-turn-helix domain-containing protein [Diplocloster modestus]|uniref:Helix-turn-helix transcriptional regulator n=1 Tax=Diplocloster modestus TaxID=2850322 RepID=A0ABS6KAU9_9FIRM|nr:helix-turn-helix transcriptional regulator [Diplocloster modestus]MBU9727627.1 helix-turn-helix transcriptional regulator [Diplocloster modestus]
MKIYQNIQKLRKEMGMSQEQMAEQLGVSRQTISKWESGTVCPTLDRLQEMSRLFGIPLSQLLGESANQTEQDRILEYEEQIRRLKEQKKLHTALALAAAVVFIILAGLFVLLFFNIRSINQRIDGLDQQISGISADVTGQILGIKNDLEESVKKQESLIADYTIRPVDLKLADNQITLKFTVTPKTYTEGTNAEFQLHGNQEYSAWALYENGSFTAELPISVDETAPRLQVNFINEGKTSSEILDDIQDVLHTFIMPVGGMDELAITKSGRGIRIDGTAAAAFTPIYEYKDDGQPRPLNYPVSGKILVMKNDRTILEKPLDITPADYQETVMSNCYVYAQFQDQLNDCKTGDTIRILSTLTDNYGNIRQAEVRTYMVP